MGKKRAGAEQEWLTATDPRKMLHLLPQPVSRRKLVLFVAASRSLIEEFEYPELIEEMLVWERSADGQATDEDVIHAREVYSGEGNGSAPEDDPLGWAELQAEEIAEDGAYSIAGDTEDLPNPKDDPWHVARSHLHARQCALLRCIFGNPFRRMTIDRKWLCWNDGIVGKLAQAIYEERGFDRLSILADALEEAGRSEQAILDHCRRPGEHARGCWVVDAILGKE